MFGAGNIEYHVQVAYLLLVDLASDIEAVLSEDHLPTRLLLPELALLLKVLQSLVQLRAVIEEDLRQPLVLKHLNRLLHALKLVFQQGQLLLQFFQHIYLL